MYAKRTSTDILPMSDAIIKFLIGVTINKKIKNTAMTKQMQTFFVLFEYSITIIDISISINNIHIIFLNAIINSFYIILHRPKRKMRQKYIKK